VIEMIEITIILVAILLPLVMCKVALRYVPDRSGGDGTNVGE
jgi:hypothetical protein